MRYQVCCSSKDLRPVAAARVPFSLSRFGAAAGLGYQVRRLIDRLGFRNLMTAKIFAGVRRLLTVHALPLSGVFAAVLALPTLNSPLLQDDVVHRVMLLDKSPNLHWGPLELYDFIGAPSRPVRELRDRGFLPWFASDSLRIRFLRPLSSAVLAADAKVFGDRTWASRLHSLGWFLGILVVANAIHRRFLAPLTAGLASVIYSVSFAHMMPVGWIAARHTLICSALSLVSFACHVRGRDSGARSVRWFSTLAFAAGLLAGEMTLGTVALIAAWEWLAANDSQRKRIVALLPFAALTLIYLAFYLRMGYGVTASGGYISLTDGFGGAIAAVRHFFILLGDLVGAVPSDPFGTAATGVQTAGAVIGLTLVAGAVALLRVSRPHLDDRDRIAVRWLAVATAGAALPGAFALVGGRVLTLALVPASGVVAILLVAGFTTLRRNALPTYERLFAAAMVIALATGHLGAAPILRILGGMMVTRLAVEQHTVAALTPPCSGSMVIVAAADPTVATYVPATMALGDRGPERLRVLSMAPVDHRIENVTRSGFDLVARNRRGTETIWEALYGNSVMRSGAHVRIPSLDALILEDRDGLPMRVRFDFGEPLDSGRLCFYEWSGRGLVPIAPPRPGQTRDLPHRRGPMGW
jgi:hypothetical protein